MVRITLNKPYIPIPVPVTVTAVKYGLLYNWFAATDARNIAADGWEVPTDTQLDSLVTYLGGILVAGGELKESGLLYFNTPNTGAVNSVGFNGRGNGIRQAGGTFSDIKNNFNIWNKTDFNATIAFQHTLGIHSSTGITNGGLPKTSGMGVRPIKTTTTLTHGQTGTYTGNDGKVYRTICIGTQEWLADNLCETKYRNGDTIPEVTNNAEWAALSTGALCAYNNDWSNVLI